MNMCSSGHVGMIMGGWLKEISRRQSGLYTPESFGYDSSPYSKLNTKAQSSGNECHIITRIPI